MIKALTAYTSEIDDVALAVSEVLDQVDLGELLKNSVGILTCCLDFFETGVVKALCAKLPFEVVGGSSIGCAVPGGGGISALSLFVLTSDDVSFSVALSGPLDPKNQRDPIGEAYRSALEGLPVCASGPCASKACALGLLFMPFVRWIGSDEILGILDEASGGVPMFGMLAAEYTTNARAPLVLSDGEGYADRLVVVLLSGDVHPRFACTSIVQEKVSKNPALVTDSEGNLLKTVDNMPVAAYLEKFGLAEKGRLQWETTIPMLIDRRDGTQPASLVVLDQTPEGHIRMGGSVPMNSTIRIGSIDHDDVLNSVADVAKLAKERTSVFFFFSCVLRGMVLNLDERAEIDRAAEILGDSVPYLFAYAGGEICPLYSDSGGTVNRFQNIAAIGCAL
jgi:hypothetical protein